jgi:DNA-binding NarL/FixJ family response regulator
MVANALPQTIRVALVDDHAIVRQGLRALLSRAEMEVVAEADSGPAAVEVARQHRPDVMLLDIRMKNGDGLQSLASIRAASPQTSIIMLTTYANPGYLARAIQGGAVGYLSKEADPHQIIRAVRAAVEGDPLMDRSLLEMALAQAVDDAPPSPEPSELPIEPLSERERDVLRLIAQGLNNQAIAETLCVSIPTVKTHVQHILHKLHVADRTQAALLAMRQALV